MIVREGRGKRVEKRAREREESVREGGKNKREEKKVRERRRKVEGGR